MHIPEDEEGLSRVPLTTLYRWFMYDMNVEDPNEHLDVFDITPISEEGDEKERQDAEDRAERIEDLLPFLNLYANLTAQYIFEMQKSELIGMQGVPEEKLELEAGKIKSFYRTVSLAALMTTFSSAVELGIVSFEGVATGVIDE